MKEGLDIFFSLHPEGYDKKNIAVIEITLKRYKQQKNFKPSLPSFELQIMSAIDVI